MRRLQVKSGERFSRLTVVSEAESSNEHRRFMCQCTCGNVVIVHLSALRTGLSKSCGCLRKEKATTHGKHRTAEYRTWSHIVTRCTDPKHKAWKNYGGRGIEVCEEWRKSFVSFLEYVGMRPSPYHSIDRINNDGNYEPGNVRWSTMSEQLRNTRRSAWVLYQGKPRLRIEVAEELGIKADTLDSRIRRGSKLSRHIARCFKP